MERVIHLGDYSRFTPDVGRLASRRVASARDRLSWSRSRFAAALDAVVPWAVSEEVLAAWESETTPPGDVLVAAELLAQGAEHAAGANPADVSEVIEHLVSDRFADVVAVFPTRAAFTSAVDPSTLFDEATEVSIVGLSLNLVCQQYPDRKLRRWVAGGGRIRCLFLAPNGHAIGSREREEDYPPGHLSSLTEMNIRILARMRLSLAEDVRQRLVLATYDEPVRFNIVLIDNVLCIVQPYLSGVRGLDSPTLLIKRQPTGEGLFSLFEQTCNWLWGQACPVP